MVAGLSKALKRRRPRCAHRHATLLRASTALKHGITLFALMLRPLTVVGEEVWVGIFEGKLDGEVPGLVRRLWRAIIDRPYIYNGDEDSLPIRRPEQGGTARSARILRLDSANRARPRLDDGDVGGVPQDVGQSPCRRLSQYGKRAHDSQYRLPGKIQLPTCFRSTDSAAITWCRTGSRISEWSIFSRPGFKYADIGNHCLTHLRPRNSRPDRRHGAWRPTWSIAATGSYGIRQRRRRRKVWNPATDKYLPARFSRRRHVRQGGRANSALQERFGLTVDPKIPIFGIVSRFRAAERAFDLIRGALPQALRDMVIQVVALGTGDPFTESFFRWLHDAFPRKGANAHIGFCSRISRT